jgi:hypothetical protein
LTIVKLAPKDEGAVDNLRVNVENP